MHAYPKVVHEPRANTMYHYHTFESYDCMTLVHNVGIMFNLGFGYMKFSYWFQEPWDESFPKSQLHEGQGYILAHVTSVRLLLDLFMVRWRKAGPQLVLNANHERTKGLNIRSNYTISKSFTEFKKTIILTLGLWNLFCIQKMHSMFPYIILEVHKRDWMSLIHCTDREGWFFSVMFVCIGGLTCKARKWLRLC